MSVVLILIYNYIVIKIAAFVLAFTASALLVTEIRTPRSANCFGCTNVKCVIREIDENPKLLLSEPDKVFTWFAEVPS